MSGWAGFWIGLGLVIGFTYLADKLREIANTFHWSMFGRDEETDYSDDEDDTEEDEEDDEDEDNSISSTMDGVCTDDGISLGDGGGGVAIGDNNDEPVDESQLDLLRDYTNTDLNPNNIEDIEVKDKTVTFTVDSDGKTKIT